MRLILVLISTSITIVLTNKTSYLVGLRRQGFRSSLRDTSLPFIKVLRPRSIPKSFDSRKKWSFCGTIFKNVRDQGPVCGSCWAFAAASLISQIHCIETKGKVTFHYSAQDILSCAMDYLKYGCDGGHPESGLQYWIKKGVVSGGDVSSGFGCVPYAYSSFKNGQNPKCMAHCTNKRYKIPYKKDKKQGAKMYRIKATVENMQAAIMNHGPIIADLDTYTDIADYEGRGVYVHKEGKKEADHSIIILGWGEENRVPYWLCLNSWGKDWGSRGYLKILRGKNHCRIESYAVSVYSITKRKLRGTTMDTRMRAKAVASIPELHLAFVLIIILISDMIHKFQQFPRDFENLSWVL